PIEEDLAWGLSKHLAESVRLLANAVCKFHAANPSSRIGWRPLRKLSRARVVWLRIWAPGRPLTAAGRSSITQRFHISHPSSCGLRQGGDEAVPRGCHQSRLSELRSQVDGPPAPRRRRG